MIKTILLCTVLMIPVMTEAHAESTGDTMSGVGTYSEGYRMGRLTKFSVKGMIMKSSEGEITLGKDSTALIIEQKDDKGNVTRTQKNPWAFSASQAAASVFEKYQSKYVWVHYKQAMMAGINRDTDYTVEDITPVTKQNPTCNATSDASGFKSDGFRTGRIVKASLKGTVVKTYEITMHISGNQFVDMSIADEAMYNCATEWLKSGKEVNLKYVQKMINVSFDDTNYRVVAIQPVDDLE